MLGQDVVNLAKQGTKGNPIFVDDDDDDPDPKRARVAGKLKNQYVKDGPESEWDDVYELLVELMTVVRIRPSEDGIPRMFESIKSYLLRSGKCESDHIPPIPDKASFDTDPCLLNRWYDVTTFDDPTAECMVFNFIHAFARSCHEPILDLDRIVVNSINYVGDRHNDALYKKKLEGVQGCTSLKQKARFMIEWVMVEE